MIPALLAALVSADVPREVVARAEALLRRELEGVAGEVRLSMHRTAAEMEAAARAAEPDAPSGFLAYYSYRARTVFAWMAPRPDEALFRDGLPGILVGALVHEARHARGALTDRDYLLRPEWRIEGEADAAAARASPAWRWLLESRAFRASRAGLFLPRELFLESGTRGLAPAQRSTWYAQAWLLAEGLPEAPAPDWILLDGTGEPRDGGFRLFDAVAVAREETTIDARVTLHAGALELVYGQEGEGPFRRILLGGGRVRLEGERAHPCPPLRPGTRVSFDGGCVRVEGAPALFVRRRPGRIGWRVSGGYADFIRCR